MKWVYSVKKGIGVEVIRFDLPSNYFEEESKLIFFTY
jgi:hypothetical protein